MLEKDLDVKELMEEMFLFMDLLFGHIIDGAKFVLNDDEKNISVFSTVKATNRKIYLKDWANIVRLR